MINDSTLNAPANRQSGGVLLRRSRQQLLFHLSFQFGGGGFALRGRRVGGADRVPFSRPLLALLVAAHAWVPDCL